MAARVECLTTGLWAHFGFQEAFGVNLRQEGVKVLVEAR